MVKYFSKTHVYRLPWELVINAWWNKYPNDHSKQVVQVDIVDRKLDPTTGELRIRRLISLSFQPPWWMAKLGFLTYAYALEETTINPFTKELCIESINISGIHLLQVHEQCKYSSITEMYNELLPNKSPAFSSNANTAIVNEESEGVIEEERKIDIQQQAQSHTLFETNGKIIGLVTNVEMIINAIEKYSLALHLKHANAGIQAMEIVIENYHQIVDEYGGGNESFGKILQWRLDTILLMNDLQTLNKEIFDMKCELKKEESMFDKISIAHLSTLFSSTESNSKSEK